MANHVDITFDCLPLRSVGRMDIPLDASPKHRLLCEGIKQALAAHGSHNSYFLYNARCVFYLTNADEVGMVAFRFQGTVLTDERDLETARCDLAVELDGETCDWLTEPAVEWLKETVARAVRVEFDRYIAAGDLEQARRRIDQIQAACDDQGGFVGMYL